MALSSGRDARDLQLGVGLPVPALAAVVLPAPELEDDDLLRAVLGDDLGRDLRALHQRRADGDLVATDHQHLVEGHLRARLARELLDAEPIALRHAVLLTAG